jgi:DNA invertase Pin-like site-specific DNA recombinase
MKNEQKLLEEIESGKYRDSYLIYNRKSTDDENNQKNSISYQKTENTRFAANSILPIAPVTIEGFCSNGIISEKHSGFKEDNDITFADNGLVQYHIDRPKFQKMVQFVSQGYFKGIMCLCWDRISRNGGDDILIRKLMRKGIDIRFAYTTYDKSSSGALHMDIDGMFAQHYSRVTSEKITNVLRKAREDGICTYKAPIGYLNEGNMEHKPLDPIRAPIIKQMFIYYATGDWSLSDLARYAKEQGLITVPMRRKRTKSEMLAEEDDNEVEIEKISRPFNKNGISRIFANYFYIGKLKGSDNEYINSNSHEALIDDETFYQVQTMLKKKKVSVHYTEKIDLPLRGIVRCADCQRIYTPYYRKGILYFYSRCVSECENTSKSFNFAFISAKVGELISGLCFTSEEFDQMDASIDTDVALFEEKRKKEFEQIERKKKKIREDLSYIHSSKLTLLKTGVYTPEELLEEETRLNNELSLLQRDEIVSDVAMKETIKDIQKLSELIKNLMPKYELANPQEKEIIIRIIFSELYISQNILNYKCKRGFECFENRFKLLGGP